MFEQTFSSPLNMETCEFTIANTYKDRTLLISNYEKPFSVHVEFYILLFSFHHF